MDQCADEHELRYVPYVRELGGMPRGSDVLRNVPCPRLPFPLAEVLLAVERAGC